MTYIIHTTANSFPPSIEMSPFSFKMPLQFRGNLASSERTTKKYWTRIIDGN